MKADLGLEPIRVGVVFFDEVFLGELLVVAFPFAKEDFASASDLSMKLAPERTLGYLDKDL